MPLELELGIGEGELVGAAPESEVGNVKSGVYVAPAKAISASFASASIVILLGLRTLGIYVSH
jgi:hypothetical protein